MPGRVRLRGRLALGSAALAAVAASFAVAPVDAAVAATDEECTQFHTDEIAADQDLHARLGVDAAWELTRGDGVTVAVVDSGIQGSNRHFAGAIRGGHTTYEGGEGDRSATIDIGDHGTVVAGIVAAREAGDSVLEGVAPEADLLSARVFQAVDQQGLASPSERTIADGIVWAVDQGAQIINVSMSGGQPGPYQAAIRHAERNGALIVASAGNRNSQESDAIDPTFYPAAFDSPNVLAVSGVTMEGEWSAESSYASDYVDVVAPGGGFLMTLPAGGDCVLNGPNSSWATAVVSGVAALVASAHPDETPAQWAHRIMATAQRADPSRHSTQTGWGEVRPYEALTFIDDGTALGPESPEHPRESVPEPVPAPIVLTPQEDPLQTARAAIAWTAMGGLTISLIALIVGRLGTRRRGR